jgi:hypothetical protein
LNDDNHEGNEAITTDRLHFLQILHGENDHFIVDLVFNHFTCQAIDLFLWLCVLKATCWWATWKGI